MHPMVAWRFPDLEPHLRELDAETAAAARATCQALVTAWGRPGALPAVLDIGDLEPEEVSAWLNLRDLGTSLTVVWADMVYGFEIGAELFISRWNDIIYPSGDDVWVADSDFSQILEFDHEEIVYAYRIPTGGLALGRDERSRTKEPTPVETPLNASDAAASPCDHMGEPEGAPRLHEAEEFVPRCRSIEGRRLVSARYWLASSAPSVSELDARPIHEADTVELLFDHGSMLRLRWQIAHDDERLDIDVDPAPIDPHTLVSFDTRPLRSWQPFLDRRVLGVRIGWHEPYLGKATQPWSLALTFEGGTAVTVALGEVRNERLATYLPDSLVVLFSPDAARAYRIVTSPHPAWGVAVNEPAARVID